MIAATPARTTPHMSQRTEAQEAVGLGRSLRGDVDGLRQRQRLTGERQRFDNHGGVSFRLGSVVLVVRAAALVAAVDCVRLVAEPDARDVVGAVVELPDVEVDLGAVAVVSGTNGVVLVPGWPRPRPRLLR